MSKKRKKCNKKQKQKLINKKKNETIQKEKLINLNKKLKMLYEFILEKIREKDILAEMKAFESFCWY